MIEFSVEAFRAAARRASDHYDGCDLGEDQCTECRVEYTRAQYAIQMALAALPERALEDIRRSRPESGTTQTVWIRGSLYQADRWRLIDPGWPSGPEWAWTMDATQTDVTTREDL